MRSVPELPWLMVLTCRRLRPWGSGRRWMVCRLREQCCHKHGCFVLRHQYSLCPRHWAAQQAGNALPCRCDCRLDPPSLWCTAHEKALFRIQNAAAIIGGLVVIPVNLLWSAPTTGHVVCVSGCNGWKWLCARTAGFQTLHVNKLSVECALKWQLCM